MVIDMIKNTAHNKMQDLEALKMKSEWTVPMPESVSLNN